MFISIFRYTQKREREREKRILNVKTMISFNSGFLLLFFFSPFLKSYSPITLGGKKEVWRNKNHHIAKKNDNNSKREQQQQQRQEPGVFFGPSDKTS